MEEMRHQIIHTRLMHRGRERKVSMSHCLVNTQPSVKIIGASLSEPHLVSTAAALPIYYMYIYLVRPPHMINY